MRQAVEILKGVAKLPFPEDVIEDSGDCRVITRYVPVGEKPPVVDTSCVIHRRSRY